MRRPSPTIADHGPNSLKMCICVTNIHIELTPLNGLVPVTSPIRLKCVFRSQSNLEAEPKPENVVFVIEKTSFGTYFGHLKGGVRDIRFLEPVYQ